MLKVYCVENVIEIIIQAEILQLYLNLISIRRFEQNRRNPLFLTLPLLLLAASPTKESWTILVWKIHSWKIHIWQYIFEKYKNIRPFYFYVFQQHFRRKVRNRKTHIWKIHIWKYTFQKYTFKEKNCFFGPLYFHFLRRARRRKVRNSFEKLSRQKMQRNAKQHFDNMKEAANNFSNSTRNIFWGNLSGRGLNGQGMDRKAFLVQKQKQNREKLDSDVWQRKTTRAGQLIIGWADKPREARGRQAKMYSIVRYSERQDKPSSIVV